jgi:hypothetical protein
LLGAVRETIGGVVGDAAGGVVEAEVVDGEEPVPGDRKAKADAVDAARNDRRHPRRLRPCRRGGESPLVAQ